MKARLPFIFVVVFQATPEKKAVLETASPVTTIPAVLQEISPQLKLYGRVGIRVDRLGELNNQDGHLNVLIRSDKIDPGKLIVTSQLFNAITGLKVSTETNMANIAENSVTLNDNPSQPMLN